MEAGYQIPRAALLWVLAAVTLVILPQIINLPAWLLLIALTCVVWRLLIFSGRLSYPGKITRIVAVLFTLGVSVYQMRSLGIGLESAASLLTLGFVFKLIEMRYQRDVYVVLSLCFVMSMVAFLYSQSAVMTIYVSLCVTVIVAAMISVNRSVQEAKRKPTLRIATRIALQALPLTIVLFLLFPRIAPLWAVPVPTSGGTTGVTDEMSPGDLSQLGRSNELAFRVQFEDSPPPLHAELYWRGLVLEEFDGETWSRSRSRSPYGIASQLADFQWQWQDRIAVQGEPLVYNVILEPTQQPWLYGLHLAEPETDNLFQSRNFEVFNSGLVSTRTSYDMRSYPNNQTDLILLDSARRRALQLPEQGNQRARDFATELRAAENSERDYVYAVLAFFQQNPFFYTLNPALLNQNRVDDFLFNTQEGFCEHYASAFTFLMRAAGIPARVVVGYHGAEYNRFEDFMMVYQYNAHAWSEVWLDGEGWVRVDPTGAVSPERIEQGVEAALADDPAFMEESLLAAVGLGGFNWINTLRLRLEAVEYEWNRRVVNYNEEQQFELFDELFGEIDDEKLISLLVLLAGLVVIGIGLAVTRRDGMQSRDSITQLYLKLSDELDRIGLSRLPGEGPLAYRDRVVSQRPELDSAINELTKLYVHLNYAQPRITAQSEKAYVKTMRALLRELRAVLRRSDSYVRE
jgi:transglutaminase-like putative cysteine protease